MDKVWDVLGNFIFEQSSPIHMAFSQLLGPIISIVISGNSFERMLGVASRILIKSLYELWQSSKQIHLDLLNIVLPHIENASLCEYLTALLYQAEDDRERLINSLCANTNLASVQTAKAIQVIYCDFESNGPRF